MAGTAVRRGLSWRLGEVVEARPETPRARSIALSVPDWEGHRPGQHVDLRLTAEDGYSVERSYSIASEPERHGEIDITVERIPDGEVSTFLDDVVVFGDRFEIRGLRLTAEDEPGFWESLGYHNRGDQWLEERYSGD